MVAWSGRNSPLLSFSPNGVACVHTTKKMRDTALAELLATSGKTTTWVLLQMHTLGAEKLTQKKSSIIFTNKRNS